jgi:pyruvate ferredoxin oxidoreductase gamma subunit
MFRIRFHGRGGQGVKTAAQVLGTALFLEGFEVQDAPRYGAERRGAPVFAYVRASRAPIHERGVIAQPDLVVLADETLAAMPAAGVMQGCGPATVLLVNGTLRVPFPGTVVALPAEAAAHAATRCAGAAARLLGCVRRETLARSLETELGSASPEVLAAYDAMEAKAGLVREAQAVPAAAAAPAWVELAAEDARLAAPDVRAPATSTAVPTGLWRTLRPEIDYDLCRRCHWICETYCPDSAISADAAGRPLIDYDHCKGCMVCVTVCPPHAIRAVPEP